MSSLTPRLDKLERNLIINGDMTIDQRWSGAAISASNTDNAYGVDRWKTGFTQTGKFNSGQNQGGYSLPNGFTKYFNLNCINTYSITATDTFNYYQCIEGYNTARLAWGTASAKSITLSFWVRSTATGLFGGAIKNHLLDRVFVFSYTISAANTWEYKTVVIPGDTGGNWNTDTSTGMYVVFSLGTGASLSTTAGSWYAGTNYSSVTGATNILTSGQNWNVTGVMVNEGSIKDPEFTTFGGSYDKELAACQRYVRVFNNGNNTLDTRVQGSNAWVVSKNLSPAMRAAPSLVTTFLGSYKNTAGGPGANQWQFINIGTGGSVTWGTAPTGLGQTTSSREHTYVFQNTGATPNEAVAGQIYNLTLGTGSAFFLDAELT
jgi:hypothetical protein